MTMYVRNDRNTEISSSCIVKTSFKDGRTQSELPNNAFLKYFLIVKKIFHCRFCIKHCVINTCTQGKQNMKKVTKSVVVFIKTEKL